MLQGVKGALPHAVLILYPQQGIAAADPWPEKQKRVCGAERKRHTAHHKGLSRKKEATANINPAVADSQDPLVHQLRVMAIAIPYHVWTIPAYYQRRVVS